MDERKIESRHLPAAHARRMAQLATAPACFDGRSRKWTSDLAETGFVKIEVLEDKKRVTIKAEITERGKIALERDRRGVDPYLIMT